jgi:ribosomal protein S18 acetylase RimI-like enzyme
MQPISIERLSTMDSRTIDQVRADFDDTDWQAERIQEFLADQNNILIVAKVAQRIVGLLVAHRLARLDSQRAQVLLYEIDVLPAFQQTGIGSAMIERLKELAQQVGACEVWVATNKSNEPAMRLYRSTGATAKQDDDVVFEYKL